MRRMIRILLLALGTTLGYGFAIHSMRHHHCYANQHDGYNHGFADWCDHHDAPMPPAPPGAVAPSPATPPATPPPAAP